MVRSSFPPKLALLTILSWLRCLVWARILRQAAWNARFIMIIHQLCNVLDRRAWQIDVPWESCCRSIHWYQKGTVQKVAKWKLIADNLLEILEPKFKVDSRAVRDRYQLLAQKLRKLMNLKYSTMSLKSHSTDSPTPLFDVLMASCSGFNTACLYGPCKWTLRG